MLNNIKNNTPSVSNQLFSMKKLFLLTAVLSLFLFMFNACEDGDLVANNSNPSNSDVLDKDNLIENEMGDFNARLDRLTEYLVLSSDQIEQLKEFMKQQRSEFKGNHGSRKGNRFGMREKGAEMREKMQEFLKGILTVEQKIKLEELNAKIESGEFHKERMEKWLDKLSTELNLSDDQKTQVKELFEKRADKMKELKNQDLSRGEMMKNRKGFFEEIKTEMVQILTDEQLEKFKEVMQKNKDKRFGRGHHGFGRG